MCLSFKTLVNPRRQRRQFESNLMTFGVQTFHMLDSSWSGYFDKIKSHPRYFWSNFWTEHFTNVPSTFLKPFFVLFTSWEMTSGANPVSKSIRQQSAGNRNFTRNLRSSLDTDLVTFKTNFKPLCLCLSCWWQKGKRHELEDN